MVAGGHFAGVVVRVSRPSIAPEQGKGKQKKAAPEMEILRHKTFHRYTSAFSPRELPCHEVEPHILQLVGNKVDHRD